MNLGLAEQVAFVAGSSRGIGRAIARSFLDEGARVAITGRDEVALAGTEAELAAEFGAERVLARGGDLGDPLTAGDALRDAVERWGRVDCLVANVGSGTARPGWQLTAADWEQVFAVNLWTSLRVVEAALPQMVEAGRGSIVLVSSIVGVESLPAPLPYSAAKAALVNYSKNLARQLGPSGVRVNCVAPGNILFPGGSWEKKLQQNREQVDGYIQAEVPLRRFGTPEEVADLVVFLASERAEFITGACVVADGGQTRAI